MSPSRWSIGWQRPCSGLPPSSATIVLAFVQNRELFGDLAGEPAFTEPYLNALDSLHSRGAHATLEALATRSSIV